MSRQLQYLYVEKYYFQNKRDDLTYEMFPSGLLLLPLFGREYNSSIVSSKKRYMILPSFQVTSRFDFFGTSICHQIRHQIHQILPISVIRPG